MMIHAKTDLSFPARQPCWSRRRSNPYPDEAFSVQLENRLSLVRKGGRHSAPRPQSGLLLIQSALRRRER